MTVGNIFKVLIIVVACVLIGAFLLNLILPNVAAQLVNAIEDMIYNATGMIFDFNGDQDVGTNNNDQSANAVGEDVGELQGGDDAQVEGFH